MRTIKETNMPVSVHVNQINESGFRVILHPILAEQLGIHYWIYSILRFGLKAVEIEIQISKEVREDSIILTADIVEELSLPLDCSFEIKKSEEELHLGPFIGILAAAKDVELNKRFKGLSNYVRKYDQIKGAIFAFSFESINKQEMIMKGYLYHPRENIWVEKTTKSYPASLYINARLNKKDREYLKSIYGSKLFNYKILNKWEIHQILFAFPEVKVYLPETYLYENPNQVLRLLEKHKSIYIKPLSSFGGMGVRKLTKTAHSFLLEYREAMENIKVDMEEESLKDYFISSLEPEKYLIQQGLNIEYMDKRVCDFRVALNKDQNGKWKVSGIAARIGNKESVVSNFLSGGSVTSFEKVLLNHFQLEDRKISEMKEKVMALSIKIINCLEKSGQRFGKLAIDLAIDKELRLWMIELNNRSPNDFLFAYAGDIETTYEMKLDNMLYAKGLAGFHSDN
jgi:glutathione synthase/RimK-type ligase-like ATP-grasp enzyme